LTKKSLHTDYEYNYDFQGRDWALTVATCDSEFQSPINLMPPVTDYGPSYRFYDFNSDNLKIEFADAYNTLIFDSDTS